MKNYIKSLVFIVIVTAIGFSLATCGGDSDGGGSEGGDLGYILILSGQVYTAIQLTNLLVLRLFRSLIHPI